jgi:iron complex outermembrane receptor protein
MILPKLTLLLGLGCTLLCPGLSFAEGGNTNAANTNKLVELDLEDLMKVKVTSVSKRPESLAGAASAVYLLSGDEVVREGFRSIADSLRYVPGMQVAQLNSHTWAVSARGFDAEYATKLLVLMDGRSVYTPLNAGVYWDTVDLMLEDLERIEVIRGPGGTLWGANAVNGVINITSKSSRETQGWLMTGGGGNQEQGFTGARYGGQLGEQTFFRVYGKYDSHDDMAFSDGSDGEDAWQMGRAGFRLDSGNEEANLFTLQGDYYQAKEKWLYLQPIPTAPFSEVVNNSDDVLGANLLGRWSHRFEDDSQFTFQTYYDHTDRESNLPRERRDTFDVDLQHHIAPISRHNIVLGLGYRFTTDDIEGNYANSFDPDERSLNLFSGFVQDEITLVEERLRLTLGTKVEHNDFTGVEYQPGARLAWTPAENQTLWASVARAVRTPSRAADDVRINRNDTSLPPGLVASILGDRSGESEELMAYEIGYRALPVERLSVDVATFYNVYDELRSLEPGATPPTPPNSAIGLYTGNELKGESWGAELATDWEAGKDWWHIRTAYTYLHLDLDVKAGGTDVANIVQLLEGNAPRHQFSVRSQMDIRHNLEFDIGLRYVDELQDPDIPAYTTMDIRIAWRPRSNLELSVVGLNLLDPLHPEFAPTQVQTPQREVERSVYGQITCHF